MIVQNTKNTVVLSIKMCELPKSSDNVPHNLCGLHMPSFILQIFNTNS